MKKIVAFGVILLFLGVLWAQTSDYFYSLLVRTKITMASDPAVSTQSAKIYFYDTDQYIFAPADGQISVVAATFLLSSTVCDTNSFTTTAAADTVLISGALSTDKYFITGIGGSVDQQDVLQAEAKADTLIVHRLASGASGLKYQWLRIR